MKKKKSRFYVGLAHREDDTSPLSLCVYKDIGRNETGWWGQVYILGAWHSVGSISNMDKLIEITQQRAEELIFVKNI